MSDATPGVVDDPDPAADDPQHAPGAGSPATVAPVMARSDDGVVQPSGATTDQGDPSPATAPIGRSGDAPHAPADTDPMGGDLAGGDPVGGDSVGSLPEDSGPDDDPGETDVPAAPSEGPWVSSVGGRPLPRVIAVANQKGGVGKTTTTVNLSAALAERDFRVLVIDLDPQGNATTGLGINSRTLDNTMYEVLLQDVPLEDAIEPTEVKGLFVAPASLDLAGAEIELVPAFSREGRLRRALAEVIDDYDYVLIDCPPSLGLLTVNGLVAATELIVPIQCEYYALEGLAQLTKNVELVRSNLNPELEISGIVLVMYDSRTRLGEQVVQEVRDHFGPKVCRVKIPRNIKLSEAPSFGQPITTFDPSSRGAVAYRELAREVSGGA